MKPSRMVISMINMVTNLIPSWKSIISGPDIVNNAIKLSQKRQEVLFISCSRYIGYNLLRYNFVIGLYI